MNNLDGNTKALIFSMVLCTILISTMLVMFSPRSCEVREIIKH